MPPSVATSQLLNTSAHATKEPLGAVGDKPFLEGCCTNNTQPSSRPNIKPLINNNISDLLDLARRSLHRHHPRTLSLRRPESRRIGRPKQLIRRPKCQRIRRQGNVCSQRWNRPSRRRFHAHRSATLGRLNVSDIMSHVMLSHVASGNIDRAALTAES